MEISREEVGVLLNVCYELANYAQDEDYLTPGDDDSAFKVKLLAIFKRLGDEYYLNSGV